MRSSDHRFVPERLRRLPLLADAVRRLGPSWVAFRIRYFLEHRLGLLERRSPIRPWPPLEPAWHAPPIVAVESLRRWLSEHVDDRRRVELLRRVDDLRARRFDVFGTAVSPQDWHHDPTADVRYPPDVHWSRVPEFPAVDIKRVWEPSRFGWAFDLARAHLIAPGGGAADLFWEVLDEWCAQNPPNAGVNWQCGQESSIRLMAVVAASAAMSDTIDGTRASIVRRFAHVTADRVEANIGYARSQRNNHQASEAAGLLTASLLYGEPPGRRWRAVGEAHLKEVCDRLVFADGGTSQYSTNYHRVFVHDLLWVVRCYRVAGATPPPWLLSALGRATDYLEAIVDPVSGGGPFFGPDDGARVLPLSGRPHRHLADDARLARAVLDDVPAAVSQTEPAAWFGLDDPSPPPSAATPGPWSQSFPDAGLHIVGRDGARVYIRCGRQTFRPTQDDLLHCSVWSNGVDLTPDPGTQSYHPAPGEPGPLDRSSDHNGPRLAGREGMPRVSRFLWARWPDAACKVTEDREAVVFEGRVSFASGATVRTVTVDGDGVSIVDTGDGHAVETHLATPLDAAGAELAGPEHHGAVAEPYDAIVSPGYGRWEHRRGLKLTGDRIVLRWRH